MKYDLIMMDNKMYETMLKFAKINANKKGNMHMITSKIDDLTDMMIKIRQDICNIKNRIALVETSLNEMIEADRFDLEELEGLINKKCFAETGAIGSDKYILFFGKFKSNLVSSVKKHFGRDGIKMMSIKDLKKSDMEEAKLYINRWKPTPKLKTKILGDILTEINKLDKGKKSKITQVQIDAYNNYMEEITR